MYVIDIMNHVPHLFVWERVDYRDVDLKLKYLAAFLHILALGLRS